VVAVLEAQNPSLLAFSVPPNGVPLPFMQHWRVVVPSAKAHAPPEDGHGLALMYFLSLASSETTEVVSAEQESAPVELARSLPSPL
jgi:hypothetical protein